MSSTTTTTATATQEQVPLPTKSWQSICEAKQAEQLSRIPEEWRLTPEMYPAEGTIDLRPVVGTCGILTERELLITGETYDATSLAAEIAKGTYTATETITAFCKRAAVGQQLCSFLTEIRFAEAIEKAKKLDEHFAKTGKTVGPLHGLAMTFKECFHIKGYDACNGYVSRCFDKSTTTTPVIQLVEEAGAVVIAKTNIPQTMLVAECHNNVFGHTKNPIVSNLSCGGSSGGEGSIAAWRGSALGVGTDVGGSIRLPAAFNAVYGYKPSVGILPFIGYAPSGWTGVNSGIPAVLGPLGQSIRDMKLFMDVVRAQQPWKFDPAVIPGIMETPLFDATKKPVVGILYESGITPHPPVQRILREAVAKIKAAGYEVRDFTPTCPDFKELRDITAEMLTSDGLSYQTRELAKSGEPAVPSVVNFGYWGNRRQEHEEVWALNTRKGAFQKKMLDTWQTLGIDILIAPSVAHTPIPSDKCTSELYTVCWNAMDYPAIIVPFGKADKAVDIEDPKFVAKNDLDAKIHTWYDAELMHNSPTSIQLVGPRLGDASLLHYAEELDKVLHA